MRLLTLLRRLPLQLLQHKLMELLLLLLFAMLWFLW